MADAAIESRAQELVLYELSGKPSGHIHYASYGLAERTEGENIAVHKRAAELYQLLIKAAPGVWADAGRIQRLAANAAQEGNADGC